MEANNRNIANNKGKRYFTTALTSILGNRLGATLLRPLWAGRAVIFMSHRLSSQAVSADAVTIDSIGRTLSALRRAGASFVSLRHLFELAVAGREPEEGSVAFTIDDGYADQGVMAEKAFIENGCPVTVFLISELLDGKLWPWDDRLAYAIKKTPRPSMRIPAVGREFQLTSDAERRLAVRLLQNLCKERSWAETQDILETVWAETGITPPQLPPEGYEPLSWQEARRLESIGVEFAPHSATHRITSRLADAEAQEEIRSSWNRLLVELKRPVPVYAWPTGRFQDYSKRDMGFAAATGFSGAVATNNDYADFRRARATPFGMFAIDRFSMSSAVASNLQYGTAIERLKQLVLGRR